LFRRRRPAARPATGIIGGDRNTVRHATNAVPLQTGATRWADAIVTHHLWDCDLGAQPVLVAVTIYRAVRRAILQASKTGNLFLLEAATSELLCPVEQRLSTTARLRLKSNTLRESDAALFRAPLRYRLKRLCGVHDARSSAHVDCDAHALGYFRIGRPRFDGCFRMKRDAGVAAYRDRNRQRDELFGLWSLCRGRWT